VQELAIIRDFDLTALSWPMTAQEEVMDALRFILGDSLTLVPRRRGSRDAVRLNDLAWCFVAGEDFCPMGVRTYSTLEKKVRGGVMYFTPNTFYNRRRKTSDSLRWLNAFFADIDDAALSGLDVLDRVQEAGLPPPTLVSKTPHGIHCFWKLKRVRATEKALRLYSALLKSLAAALSGDTAAATPEHFMRIPQCHLYYKRLEYTMQDFLDWAELNAVLHPRRQLTASVIVTRDILHHPAVRKLLAGVENGRRNNTALTLALCYRVAGYSEEEAFNELDSWNLLNKPPLRFSELASTIKSAYSGRYRGPAAKWVEELSGVPFRYRYAVVKQPYREGAPGRPEKVTALARARAKLYVAVKSARNGRLKVRSHKDLACRLGVAERTLWRAKQELERSGYLTVVATRHGRHGTTTTLQACHVLTLPRHNTYGCRVAGRGCGVAWALIVCYAEESSGHHAHQAGHRGPPAFSQYGLRPP